MTENYCVLSIVRVSVRKANTRINNFQNISDFNVVACIGDKTKFCADDDKY